MILPLSKAQQYFQLFGSRWYRTFYKYWKNVSLVPHAEWSSERNLPVHCTVSFVLKEIFYSFWRLIVIAIVITPILSFVYYSVIITITLETIQQLCWTISIFITFCSVAKGLTHITIHELLSLFLISTSFPLLLLVFG